MTCPFYVCDGRPECILGDDRAERHCGPRQYPQSPCNLDAIGRGEAWRAVLDQLVPLLAKMDRPFVIDETTTDEQMEAWYDTRLMWSERLLALGRLGWSP